MSDTLLLWRVQAEARAEFAERSVQKLQKEVDRLEGMSVLQFFKYFKQNVNFSNKFINSFQLKYIQLFTISSGFFSKSLLMKMQNTKFELD